MSLIHYSIYNLNFYENVILVLPEIPRWFFSRQQHLKCTRILRSTVDAHSLTVLPWQTLNLLNSPHLVILVLVAHSRGFSLKAVSRVIKKPVTIRLKRKYSAWQLCPTVIILQGAAVPLTDGVLDSSSCSFSTLCISFWKCWMASLLAFRRSLSSLISRLIFCRALATASRVFLSFSAPAIWNYFCVKICKYHLHTLVINFLLSKTKKRPLQSVSCLLNGNCLALMRHWCIICVGSWNICGEICKPVSVWVNHIMTRVMALLNPEKSWNSLWKH